MFILKRSAIIILLIIFHFHLVACNSSSGTSSVSSAASEQFPVGMAVASPLDLATSSSSSESLDSMLSASTSTPSTSFSSITSRMTSILSASSISSCSFDPSLFLQTSDDAECYGPNIDYQDHPDATSGSDDGQLPSGDLGMWSAEEGSTGEACSAAQLNARMTGMQNQTNAAMQSAASVICVSIVNGVTPPNNSTNDLTSYMTSLAGSAGLAVTFNTVTMTHSDSSGNDVYTITLDFEYTSGSTIYPITVNMSHQPGTSGNYQGQIGYQYDFTDSIAGNCPSTSQTLAGSVVYNKSSSTINVQSKTAQFCGGGASPFNSSGVVDVTDKFDGTSGWGNQFDIFTAEFNQSTLVGNYYYAWQAGYADRSARIFNVTLASTGGVLSGTAFFGFGDDIEDTDGNITGFYCNWAGPGAALTQVDKVQVQEITEDSTSGIFEVDSSNITYAPTNNCDYDGTSTFVYDKDDDNDLTDEDATATVTNNLEVLTGDSDGDGIENEIDSSGFVLPSTPSTL